MQGFNDTDADQTVQKRRLICIFVVPIWHKRFVMRQLSLYGNNIFKHHLE